MFIGGEFIDSPPDLKTIDRASAQPPTSVPEGRKTEIARAVVAARRTFDSEPRTSRSSIERARPRSRLAVARATAVLATLEDEHNELALTGGS